jgi:hypothetical protein
VGSGEADKPGSSLLREASDALPWDRAMEGKFPSYEDTEVPMLGL